ncbi:M3 family metallopeptidase [Pseudomonas sp. Z3-8]|uniref:M3 family metallopeptidase n=1 Tax=Pseudomonas sp. Z3-8 TaxID=2817412 RepID=UPI003DA95349
MPPNNPLLSTYDLPPFSTIRVRHLVPAIEKIIAESHLTIAEIIASQTLLPTWDDLVLAMDAVKARLEGTMEVIDILGSVNAQQEWRDAVTRCIELATDFKALLWGNKELFQLYRRLADSRMARLFDSPRRRVLDKILEEFRLAGIHLAQAPQQRLAELNVYISRLEREFLLRVEQAGEAWSKHIEDESLLAGVPDSLKQSMANDARAKNLQGWQVRLDDEQYRMVMLHAEHRPLRQAMWLAYHARATGQEPFAAQPGNDDVLRALLEARHEKAGILGYGNFAELVVDRQMAQSTDQVLAFLRDSLDGYRSLFASEAEELKALALQHGIAEPQPWDYEYLAEKIRRQEGASQQQLREYFPLEGVLNRLCQFIQQLFGVELLERPHFDTWHDDVRLFELKEHGQAIGYLYVDPYRHEPSGVLGQMRTLRNRRVTAEGRPRLPIAVLQGNLTPGVGEMPSLLDHEQLKTLLHELGHCLQLLLTRAQHRDISGLNGLALDATEFAAQVFEQWSFSRQFLVWVSSHYQTGEPLPAEQADRLLTATSTQTSWAAANDFLQVLFDLEVHRTSGDGRSTQEIFDALNTEVGQLQWPVGARPFNSWVTNASRYAAATYAYFWANELARTAYGQFVANGEFDSETGRAFREAFFTHGDTRRLTQSLEGFLGHPVDSLVAPVADESEQADSAPDPSASLIHQLDVAQQRMIRLNDAVPVPSAIAKQHLNDWFASTFPTLAETFSVQDLWVRPRQGPAMTLNALFWRAATGRANLRELFLDLGEVDIVHEPDTTATVPAGLNSTDAKTAIERMLGSAPIAYESQLKQALDRFWEQPADFSAGRNVIDWLADELGGQLMTQADLHLLDATLTPRLHKAITDYALSAPDAASREEMLERIRPGVYAVQYTPPEWEGSLPVRDAVILTQPGSDDLAAAALWRPGEPLEAVDSLVALTALLQQNGEAQGEVHLAPLPENFVVRQANALREEQKQAVLEVLQYAAQEPLDTWVQRLDQAVGLGESLDLTWTMDAYQLRCARIKLNDWLHGYRYVSGADRLAWWAATQDWRQTVEDMILLPPDPVALATSEAIENWTRTELARLIREKNLVADPDQIFLSIRKQIVDPRTPHGTSPFESGIVLDPVKSFFEDRRSLAKWAMSNLMPDERDALHHSEAGPLSFAQIKDLIASADVGARLPAALQLKANERKADWMALKGKALRTQVWTAHISGDLTYDRHNTGLNLVLAVLDSPTPAGRRKINGHETQVCQIQWGDSVLNDVLAFGVKTPASRPSLTLYTPQAPDGKVFREVHAGASRDLTRAVARALTRTPEMTHWLISRLPLAEQAAQVASMAPTDPNLTTNEKIKHVTQSILSFIKSKAVDSFSSGASFPVVGTHLLEALHETQVSHALKAVDALTVSNAERDSTAAQEGRREGISLLTGMLSMFPASRLGGMLGRAILPVMAGGAAVAAIKDENGSLDQWAGDFISGLRDVLAEGGEDLIMSRASKRRRKTRPLSTLPPMPASELKPLRLKGMDGKGLIPEGRDLFRDAGGQGYLKQGRDYYKTAMQGGERIVYAPANRADQRNVKWVDGQWQAKERDRLRGGGPILSLLKTPDTPHNALVEGALAGHPNPTSDMYRDRRDTAHSMPTELTERILRESMDDVGVSHITAYRSLLHDLNQGTIPSAPHKNALLALRDKLSAWKAVDSFARHFEQNITGTELSTSQKIKIFDSLLRFRKELHPTDIKFKTIFSVISDRLTGAKFIVIAAGQKMNALKGIQDRVSERNKTAEEQARNALRAKFNGDIPAADKYIDTPEGANEYAKIIREHIRDGMKATDTPGLLTEIRSNRLSYLVYNKGKSQKKNFLINAQEIQSFESSLKYFAAPEIEIVTRLPSKKIPHPTPAEIQAPVEPEVPVGTDRFTVKIGPLAETQLSYDNFPEPARAKINEIMDDIRTGRTTTKRINQFYWYDMAQLDPGSGRGAWRAAFERKGDTWELQGFYSYHTNRQAIVWGD